ncbi:hypothetical protein V494_00370 [Pseudogymnoascus sp. VKM F-4513 (FW-928)]|nr:hypothetical protein V494_00370 [Pseudogymnoascus sp. VKM F-4513 (FW-928)]
MADQDDITFSLQPGGQDVENSTYRTRNRYDGQVEREDVYDQGKALNMQMTLVDVIHGVIDATPDSSAATLIIADFRFVSHDPSRRFQHATIELRFRATNDALDLKPPEVLKIAPMGPWGLQKTEKTQAYERGANVSAGGTFVANVTAGLDWTMTTTQTQYNEAKITGMPTKRKRKVEPKNAVVWSMVENEDLDTGIPSLLRTAILLKRQTYDDFYCYVSVETKLNWRPEGLSPSVESRKAGGDTDHILFSPRKVRTKVPFAGIIPSNLGNVVLNELMAVTTRESIAPPVPSTVLKDGQPFDSTQTTKKSEETVLKAEEPRPKSDGMRSSEPKIEGGITSQTSRYAEKQLQFPDSTLESAIIDPLRGTGLHPSQKTDELLPTFSDTAAFVPGGLKFEEGSRVEETLRLLLHAVRRGVEVIAEANRIRLEAWPEEQNRQ